MPLTLKDIAKMVGVAESTVSRAINNKPGVGQETREKIMELVRKYDYEPNKLAQGLAKKETHLLALLLSDLNKPGYIQVIESIESVANKAGYQVIICNYSNDLDKKRAYLNLVKRRQVDGAIIVGGELADENILNLALNEKDSIVLVNSLIEELVIPSVLIDNAEGAYLATKHLLDQELNKIAIIMGPSQNYLESEKLAGYKRALRERGIPFKSDYVFQTDGSREDGFNTFLSAINLEVAPRAFFVTSDILAAGLIESIKMGGYIIPDDFAVVAYGKSILTSVITPKLTLVAEPLSQLGKLAAQNLIKLISGEFSFEVIKVLKPVLEIGDSSIPRFNR